MTTVFLSMAGVADRLGLSPHTVKKYYNDGRLPEPDAQIGQDAGRRIGWLPETIDEWQANRPGRGKWRGPRAKDSRE